MEVKGAVKHHTMYQIAPTTKAAAPKLKNLELGQHTDGQTKHYLQMAIWLGCQQSSSPHKAVL